MSDPKPLFQPVPYAFPFDVQCIGSRDLSPGMTLRDYFAAQAVPAVLRRYGGSADAVAELAYQFADAMLKARGR